MKTDQSKFDAKSALVIGSAVFLGVVFAAATAHAGSCEALEHVNYSAAFNLPAENAKASSEPLRLVVGTAKTAEDVPQMVAQILDGKNCQAVCHIKAFARNENTLAPVSMEMECQATQFRVFSSQRSPTPVTLTWATSREGDPEIRIGTWFEGYRRSALRVELDNYRDFTPTDRVIARAN